MAFDDILAQPAAVAMLRHALDTAQLSQAYLFAGPSGVGKERAALALACAALCTAAPSRGCGQCDAERRVRQGLHPDVRVYRPRDEGNRNLQVEYVRTEVLPVARSAPFEAVAAFLIFPQADVSFPVTHPEAANALLKTLEEPRARVHFVLLTERPERLLPTVRSRAQRVTFRALPDDALEQILTDRGVPEAARGPAIALAGGRADRALALSEEGHAQRLLDWTAQVDDALRSGDTSAMLDVSETLARHDDRSEVLEALALYYRDVAATGLGLPQERLRFAGWAAPAKARAQGLDPSAAAERVRSLLKLGEALERNANPQVALDGWLLGKPRFEFPRPRG